MQPVMMAKVFMSWDIAAAPRRNQAEKKKGRPEGRPIALEAM
jgi:hypothetical protein